MIVAVIFALLLSVRSLFSRRKNFKSSFLAFLVSGVSTLLMFTLLLSQMSSQESGIFGTVVIATSPATVLSSAREYGVDAEHVAVPTFYFDQELSLVIGIHIEPLKSEKEGGPRWCDNSKESCRDYRTGLLETTVLFVGFHDVQSAKCNEGQVSLEEIQDLQESPFNSVLLYSRNSLDRSPLLDNSVNEAEGQQSDNDHLEVADMILDDVRQARLNLHWLPKNSGNSLRQKESEGASNYVQLTCRFSSKSFGNSSGGISNTLLPPALLVHVPRVLFMSPDGAPGKQSGILSLVVTYANIDREFKSIPQFNSDDDSRFYRGVSSSATTTDGSAFYFSDRPAFVVYPKYYEEKRAFFIWFIGIMFSLVLFNLRACARFFELDSKSESSQLKV